MLHLPLEVKILIIRDLSPYLYGFNPKYERGVQQVAYMRDLCAVCLVWPDTIAIIRRIIFKMISIRPNEHRIDASLRNLCQALENDPNVCTFVTILELSASNPSGGPSHLPEDSPFIPTSSQPLFRSFLSFIPNMCNLVNLRLDNIRFHQDTSLDLRVLKGSSVMFLALENCSFSFSSWCAFLGYWEQVEIMEFCLRGINFLPDTIHSWDSEQTPLLAEEVYNWDRESTWAEWKVNKPSRSSFVGVTDLELTLSEAPGCGMLMLMDLLASAKWSPVMSVNTLQIWGSTMTATTVIRINNLIRRYETTLDTLWLNEFRDFEDAIGTPLYLAGIPGLQIDLTVYETLEIADDDEFDWYVESLAAVPPNSRLQEVRLHLTIDLPREEISDLQTPVFWEELDTVLCGDNLELDSVTFQVAPTSWSADFTTRGAEELRTWLREMCFPKVTAKYFRRSS
ncbi:hypothetical protein BDZ89DRAFT_1122348 [Hymenopellis radicata]|nr:hypothetical protein BDZ89DRAFT_1122348 [Hymenopellis radicata]